MQKLWLAVLFALALCGAGRCGEFKAFTIAPEAFDPQGGHVQGIAAADEALYLAQMTNLMKVDWQGKLLKRIPVISHTGDIAFVNGELYTSVAVYHGENKGKGLIQVFDKDLNLLREKLIDRGIDGIAYLDGVLYVGMGSKEQPSKNPHRVNILGRFDAKTLQEIAPRAEFDYGYKTHFGFQDMVSDGKILYGAFYASKGAPGLVAFDKDLKILGTQYIFAGNGFDLLPRALRDGKKNYLRLVMREDKEKKMKTFVVEPIEIKTQPATVAASAPSAAPQTAVAAAAGRTDLLYLSHVHRGGGKKESPDNTLPTFLWCWEHGSGVECDCRRTKDGIGIMLHDENLKRTARGITPEMARKKVSRELTYAEIKDIDVGSYIGKKFAAHRIPTIEEVFAAMKGHPRYLCFVDEKGASPDYIAQKAIAAGVWDQVYYTGPCHEQIFAWNKIMPGGKSLLWLGAWPKNRSPEERARADKWFKDKMAQLRAKGFKYITAVSIHSYYDPQDPADVFIPSTPVLKAMIDEFHAHGIHVASIPFAGGDKEEAYFKLHALGCDAFSSDYPSVMFSVIKKLKDGAKK